MRKKSSVIRWRCDRCGEDVRVEGVTLVKHVAKTGHDRAALRRRIPGTACPNSGRDVSAALLEAYERRVRVAEEQLGDAHAAVVAARAVRDEWRSVLQRHAAQSRNDRKESTST